LATRPEISEGVALLAYVSQSTEAPTAGKEGREGGREGGKEGGREGRSGVDWSRSSVGRWEGGREREGGEGGVTCLHN